MFVKFEGKKKKKFFVCVTPLVGHHVDWKVQPYGQIEKLKLQLLRRKKKLGIFIHWGCTHWSGVMLWNMAKIEGKMEIAVGNKKKKWLLVMEKKMMRIFQSIFRVGVCALHTLGRHVVNEPKVGCLDVNKFKYLKSDFRWNIHLRLYSGPSGL